MGPMIAARAAYRSTDAQRPTNSATEEARAPVYRDRRSPHPPNTCPETLTRRSWRAVRSRTKAPHPLASKCRPDSASHGDPGVNRIEKNTRTRCHAATTTRRRPQSLRSCIHMPIDAPNWANHIKAMAFLVRVSCYGIAALMMMMLYVCSFSLMEITMAHILLYAARLSSKIARLIICLVSRTLHAGQRMLLSFAWRAPSALRLFTSAP